MPKTATARRTDPARATAAAAAIKRKMRQMAHLPGADTFPLTSTPTGQDSLAAILLGRKGWQDHQVAAIEDPSHPDLVDLDKMVAVLHLVHRAGRKIVVLPDFDMDGISAGVLGYAGLAELGFDVGLHVPDYDRGHDISVAAVEEVREQFPDAAAVITCDAGINSVAGIARGKDLGLVMLVTDHHHELVRGAVDADVAVDPCRLDDPYPNKGICGAFVMWQVLDAYARRHAPAKVRAIGLLRLFAGLGTVSDVMPLLHENRQLVRDSLGVARMLHMPVPSEDLVTVYDPEQSVLMQVLRAERHHPVYTAAFEGFALMLKAYREHGRLEQVLDEDKNPVFDTAGEPVMARRRGPLRSRDDLDEGFYGFYVAPAFNAIRRVGADRELPFAVFTAPTAQEKYEAMTKVLEANELRKELVVTHMEALPTLPQPWAPWAWVTQAPKGMLGLMASRLVEEHAHPVMVVNHTTDLSAPRAGSARSPEGYLFLSEMVDGGFTAVGHEQACGVRAESADRFTEMVEHLESSWGAHVAALTLSGALEPQAPDLLIGDEPECDGGFDRFDDIIELAQALEALKPFGHGFPLPVIHLRVDLAQCRLALLGDSGDHLKIVTWSGLKLTWWNAAERLRDLQERKMTYVPGRSMVTFDAEVSVFEYMGHLIPQFNIRAMLEDGEEG